VRDNLRGHVNEPPLYDEGDRLGRVGFWVACTFAVLGIVAMVALFWFW
jgi:hypothetical protein